MEIIMKLICKEIRSEKEAAQFVALCEEEFEEKMRLAAKRTLEMGNKIITLSGPTCSGKTTTASRLVEELRKAGKNAKVISIDDFYLDDLRAENNGKVDFDSVNTIDLEYLSHVVEKLMSGKVAQMPRFDFTTGRRAGYEALVPESDNVYIFEGIQAVYPEVTSLFGDRYTSVFISVIDDVMFNGVYFESHEIRLLRRIVRDSLFRNTPIHKTLEYWDSVRTNEMENIFPNTKNPHVFIDSFLMYELFVTAPIVLGQLASPDMTKDIYPIVQGLKLRLEKIRCDVPVEKHVPTQSVFREFIGR